MDSSALAALYRKFAPLVHSRAGRLVGDDADDVVQEVFLRLIRQRPASGKEASWIYRTTTNLCLDRLRHRGRRDSAWREDLRAHVVGMGPSAPDRLAESKELCRMMIGRAPRGTREVAALIYLDGMTQEEAAAELGLSRKTVGKRLKRFTDDARKAVGQ